MRLISPPGTEINTGNWVHLVGVRESTGGNAGINRLYINGAQVATQSVAYNPTNFNNTQPLVFGRDNADFYFNGSIDEVVLFGNRALTTAEIQRQYQAGLVNLGHDVDNWTVSSSGGLWTQGPIWYNGNVPGATDYAVVQGLVGGAAVVLPESNVTAACVDVMPDGVLVFDETNQLIVNGAFNNYGAIEQVKNVNTGGGTVEFFHITGSPGTVHRGVEITAEAQNLASVQVTIYDPGSTDTGACTTNATSPDYAQRCFEILAPTNISATLRLYAADPAELNGIAVGDLRPYRFFNGAWQSLPLVGSPTTGTTDGFAYAEAVTPGFSYFLLGGPNAPTAVTLQSFNVTANNNLAVMGLVVALAAILLTAGLLITRRQTAVRER